MRRRTLLGLGLVLLSGCDLFRNLRRDDPRQFAAPQTAPPPAMNLVNYLNENVKRIQAVQCKVDIDARQGLKPGIGLDGILVCQKPLNFRLKAKAFGKPAADLGSNSEEFWFWTSQDDPPYVNHCAHQSLGRAKYELAIPIKPEMMMAALGMAEYDERKEYVVKVKEKSYELIEPVTDPSGRRIFRVTVFNPWQVSAPTPQVIAHVLRDENGKEICAATIKEAMVDPATGAVLPKVVHLTWPAQKLELTLKMREVQSVQIDQSRSARLFSRQDLSAYPSRDLASGKVNGPGGYSQGNSIQRTGGQPTGRSGW